LPLLEFAAFGNSKPGLSREFSALPFPVLQVSLLPVDPAKQAAINHRVTTVMTQASALVVQLVPALS
jgi:hypothetical protein